MGDPRRLGDLELAILRVLWDHGEASAGDVHQALADRGLAPTTIATMLRKMEDRGLCAHRRAGRQFLYRAVVAEADAQRGLVGDLVERLFGGDPAALVSHLLAEGQIDPRELDELRRRVAEAGPEREREEG
jgi:predicted transcriptional regulator